MLSEERFGRGDRRLRQRMNSEPLRAGVRIQAIVDDAAQKATIGVQMATAFSMQPTGQWALRLASHIVCSRDIACSQSATKRAQPFSLSLWLSFSSAWPSSSEAKS